MTAVVEIRPSRIGLYKSLSSDQLFSFWEAARLPVLTAAGAMCALFVGQVKLDTSKKLKQLCPGHADTWYWRVEFVILTGFGTIVGFYVFEPISPKQAIMAGLGFASTIKVLLAGGKNAKF